MSSSRERKTLFSLVKRKFDLMDGIPSSCHDPNITSNDDEQTFLFKDSKDWKLTRRRERKKEEEKDEILIIFNLS